ncbi:MAG: tRNA lysidine(34) synthetase TilS [Candidatus Riflebacteria bacterium]|nr:tRNA lysidine(34) synthetase TilS [Candidatus Riflebacteria bacterium]
MSLKKNPILQRLLSKFTIAPKGIKFAIAVSGGTDSVALLFLMREWCRMKHKEICVFHVDHSMRDTSSNDAVWVRELCEENGIDFYTRKATKEDLSQNRELGSEGWARNFRYSSFASMLKESGADIIVTGHNSNDQAETIIMRMLRGCSWRGIQGIKNQVILKFKDRELNIWRPILNISRAELASFLKSINQTWREDETNQTDLYLRNKIRHRLMPLLEEIYKGSVNHIVSLGSDAFQLQKDLHLRALSYLKKNYNIEKNQIFVAKKPDTSLRREVIRIWLEKNGLEEATNRSLIERIDDLWIVKNNGRAVKHASFEVLRHKKYLWLRTWNI